MHRRELDRAAIALATPGLRTIIFAMPTRRTFYGHAADRRAALEELQDRFFELRLAYIRGQRLSDFYLIYPRRARLAARGARKPLKYAQVFRRAARTLIRWDRLLGDAATGWRDHRGLHDAHYVVGADLEPVLPRRALARAAADEGGAS